MEEEELKSEIQKFFWIYNKNVLIIFILVLPSFLYCFLSVAHQSIINCFILMKDWNLISPGNISTIKGTGEENRKENHQPGDIGLMWHSSVNELKNTCHWIVIKQWLWTVSHLSKFSFIQISLSSCTLIIQTWLFWTQNNFPWICPSVAF